MTMTMMMMTIITILRRRRRTTTTGAAAAKTAETLRTTKRVDCSHIAVFTLNPYH